MGLVEALGGAVVGSFGQAIGRLLVLIIFALLAVFALAVLYSLGELVWGNRKLGAGMLAGLLAALLMSRAFGKGWMVLYALGVVLIAAGRLLLVACKKFRGGP